MMSATAQRITNEVRTRFIVSPERGSELEGAGIGEQAARARPWEEEVIVQLGRDTTGQEDRL
jgi:hypothetical protein